MCNVGVASGMSKPGVLLLVRTCNGQLLYPSTHDSVGGDTPTTSAITHSYLWRSL